MKVQIILVKLLILGALFIISNHNLHIGIAAERAMFFDSYTSWLRSIAYQLSDVTGYIVRFGWLPH